jgi:periplasmic protein TonB
VKKLNANHSLLKAQKIAIDNPLIAMQAYNLEAEESKNRQIAFLTTVISTATLLFLFWYITVWTATENKKVEQLGGGGFLVNFGMDKKGSGNVYTKNLASPLKDPIESKAAEAVEVKKEVKKPVVKPVEVKAKPIKPKPVKEAPVVTSKVKSPVVVKEEPPAKVTPKPSPKPVESAPAAKPTPQPKVDEGALFPAKKGTSNTNGTSGSSNRQGGAADGEGGGKGNQGQPNGNVVEGGTYKPGPAGPGGGGKGGNAGNGSSLSLTGWTWNAKPNVDDNSDETGVIRFRIKVDSDGDVVDVTQIESTVSPAVAQQYKRAVQRTKFRPTSDGDKPDISTGTVTFRLNPR